MFNLYNAYNLSVTCSLNEININALAALCIKINNEDIDIKNETDLLKVSSILNNAKISDVLKNISDLKKIDSSISSAKNTQDSKDEYESFMKALKIACTKQLEFFSVNKRRDKNIDKQISDLQTKIRTLGFIPRVDKLETTLTNSFSKNKLMISKFFNVQFF